MTYKVNNETLEVHKELHRNTLWHPSGLSSRTFVLNLHEVTPYYQTNIHSQLAEAMGFEPMRPREVIYPFWRWAQ